MKRRLIVRAQAEADITDAAVWYEKQSVGLGVEFTAEIGAAIQRAFERPLAHVRLRKSPQVHRILARRFPYRIFYIVRTNAVVVFAVIHAARHDHQWRKRVIAQ
jgi:plasmid stabilization system protein ParE